jgi:serine/threonine protein kinase
MFDLYSFAPGTLLQNRYKIEEEIGRGGFSVVYQAIDTKDQNPVAIKLLVPPPSVAHIAKERMKREVIAVQSLKHPAVVQIRDLLEEGPWTFLIMEQISGVDLQKKLDLSGPLQWESVVAIGKDMSEALHEAHRCGILHRDLKPQNILIDQNGKARLTDFGSARIQGESTVTYSGAFVGTLDYIAPEVVSGSRNDPRSDIYSLGLTLYVALTGSLPSRPSRHSPLPASVEGYRPSNSGNIPDWICSLIARATTADPSGRFPTALSFRQALEIQAKAESQTIAINQNRSHVCILCNEYSFLTNGLCLNCKSRNSKDSPISIFVSSETKPSSSLAQSLSVISDLPLDSSEVKDCSNGMKPILQVPESQATETIKLLNDNNIQTEISRSKNTAHRIPKKFYALILIVLAAGIVAGLYAHPIFFGTTLLLALFLFATASRLISRPLFSLKSQSLWPEEIHQKIVNVWRALTPGSARNLFADLVVMSRHLIVNSKASDEIAKYLLDLLESSGKAAVDLDRMDQTLQRLESQKTSMPRNSEALIESLSAGEQARDILVQRLLEAIAAVGHFQSDVALSTTGFAQQLKDCTQQLQSEIEIQAAVANELHSIRASL